MNPQFIVMTDPETGIQWSMRVLINVLDIQKISPASKIWETGDPTAAWDNWKNENKDVEWFDEVQNVLWKSIEELEERLAKREAQQNARNS